MKVGKTAIAAMALCIMANPTLASGTCVMSQDAITLKTAVLQQQLMVAAFMCGDTNAYNRFVMTYQGELQRSDEALKSYFVRELGKRGEAEYDTFKTRAANRWALIQARTGAAFCDATDALYAAAFSNRGPLDMFVASTPDVEEPCVTHDADTKSIVHLAQSSSGGGSEDVARPGR